MAYKLRVADTRALIRAYDKESAALAFVRDVICLDSRSAASRFELRTVDECGDTLNVIEGEELVRRALEDRADTRPPVSRGQRYVTAANAGGVRATAMSALRSPRSPRVVPGERTAILDPHR